MGNLTIQDVLARLAPGYPNLWIGIGTLLIIGLMFITLLFQRRPNTTIQLMLTVVILISLIDKIAIQAPAGLGGPGNPTSSIAGLTNSSIYLLLMRVPLSVFPFISAGLMRGKDNQRGVLPAIIAGFLGTAYGFLRWFFEMRG